MRRVAAIVVLSPLLAAFTPFTSVPDVCPSCPLPASDVVVLGSGEKIPCTVVAANDDFWVLERHGELRAAEKSEVAKVLWKDGKERTDLAKSDQLRTTSGVVVSGEIVEEQPGRFLALESRGLRYVVWLSQLADAHKKGKKYDPLKAPDEK